nr:hypothetical protein [uncultured Parasphingorhabdus sp.]
MTFTKWMAGKAFYLPIVISPIKPPAPSPLSFAKPSRRSARSSAITGGS